MISLIIPLALSVDSVEAFSIEQESLNFTVNSQNFLINDSYPDPSNYQSTGYVSLTMGFGNKFEFLVDDLLSTSMYYQENISNVHDMYIIVQLGTFNTTADNGYWNTSLDSNISFDSLNVLRYQLDINSPAESVDFYLWWANLGSSGGAPYSDTGGLRFYFAQLVIDYEEPIDVVNHVGTDYNLLPDSLYSFVRISEIELYDVASNSYHIRFSKILPGESTRTYYEFDVAIPSEVDMSQVIKDNGSVNMSYTTSEAGDRILYIQPNPDLLPYPNLSPSMGEVDQLMVGFSAVNLTTSECEIIEKLKINSLVNKESQDHAYAYLIFNNFEPDDVLAISMSYYYQYTYLFRTSDWFYHSEIYSHGEFSDGRPSNWLWFIPGFGWGYWLGHTILGNHYFDVDEVLLPITINDLTDELMDRYEMEMGGNRFMLNDLTLYKVHLGQFREGLSTGYNISQLAILNIIYIEEGIELSVPYEYIEFDVSYPDPVDPIIDLPGVIDDLRTFLSIMIAVGSLSVIVLLFVFIGSKFKKYKSIKTGYSHSRKKR